MESISRISAMIDPTRDLTVEAAQAATVSKLLKLGSASRSMPFTKLKALLDSRSDRDILEGLRKVIAMIYQSKPCLPYFSSVVKNVANPNIEVKKLVYIYLLHYAESDPDLALLSVNAIQKSLTDQNPQVRAMALRTMSGMRVPVISQIVSLAIKRGTSDMSPHVRKAAALSIPKCYRLDPGSLPQLLEYISILLDDKQYFVVGPAVSAYLEVCPDRIDLIHKHFRSLVRKLVDMDEWGQLATLRLLLYYCRRCFPPKSQRVTKISKADFYDDGPGQEIETGEEMSILDPDLDLFLKACKPLLQSRNSAVIIAVTSCFLHLGTAAHLESAVGPLISLLRSPPDIQQVVFFNIVSVALMHPTLFVSYVSHFFIRHNDPPSVWHLKLELLALIFPYSALHQKSLILSELEHFSHSDSVDMIRESVRIIGRCAQSDPSTAPRCFKVLLNQITSFDNVLVSEVLTVIRHLIQQDPAAHNKTIVRLARHLDKTTSPQARATIIWLVGEFAVGDSDTNIAPDVLRILAKSFAEESEEAKQQILLLGAKVYLQHLQSRPSANPGTETNGGGIEDPSTSTPLQDFDTTHPIPPLWRYILLLTRYDISYDLRDRARLFKALLSNPSSTQLASLILLAPKPVPQTPSPSESRKGLRLGSASLVLGAAEELGLSGYVDIPGWVKEGEEPDPKLRDTDGSGGVVEGSKGASAVSASARLDEAVRERGLTKIVDGTSGGKGKAKESMQGRTLDDWLDESGSEEDTEEDESEAETEDEESAEEGTTEEETDDDINNQEKRALVS